MLYIPRRQSSRQHPHLLSKKGRYTLYTSYDKNNQPLKTGDKVIYSHDGKETQHIVVMTKPNNTVTITDTNNNLQTVDGNTVSKIT